MSEIKLANITELENNLTDIADAIREKNSSNTTYAINSMASAITNLPHGNFVEQDENGYIILASTDGESTKPDGFKGFLLTNGLYNSNYNHTEISTNTVTFSDYYTGPITITGGGSRIQKAYVRIGPINLTRINLIQALLSMDKANNGSTYTRLFIGENADDTAYTVPTEQLTSINHYNVAVTNEILSLDVSNFSGEYYIFAGTDSTGNSWSTSRVVKIHHIVYSEDGTPIFVAPQQEGE